MLAAAMLTANGAELDAFAKVHPLKLNAAQWTNGFWAERVAVCRTQTIPAMWRIMSGTNYSQYLENFTTARDQSWKEGELLKLP